VTSPALIHAITPGDHFSPRTGSAIPTVVHTLASAALAAGDPRHAVLLDRSTYRPRYGSAEVIEYDGAPQPDALARRLDVIRGGLGVSRPGIAAHYRPLADALRDRPPSIVLAHNAPVLVRLLRDGEHLPVLYAHNNLLRTYSRREAGRMLDGTAGIVCVSESLAQATRAQLPRRLADLVRVVHNGADVDRFHPADPSGVDRGGDDHDARAVRVLFIGRMIPDKGADVLVRAAAMLHDPRLEVVIVGSAGFARDAPLTPFEQSLRALAASSATRIRFEPFTARDALPGLMAGADVFVIPSRWPDPCPLTVGEGLAAGLPLIASRVGGIPEIAGPSSLLVAPDDPAALARAIDSLVHDPALRRRLGAASRAHAEAHDGAWAWRTLRGALADLAAPGR